MALVTLVASMVPVISLALSSLVAPVTLVSVVSPRVPSLGRVPVVLRGRVQPGQWGQGPPSLAAGGQEEAPAEEADDAVQDRGLGWAGRRWVSPRVPTPSPPWHCRDKATTLHGSDASEFGGDLGFCCPSSPPPPPAMLSHAVHAPPSLCHCLPPSAPSPGLRGPP